MKKNDSENSYNVDRSKTYDELTKENEELTNDISVLLEEVDSNSQKGGWLKLAWSIVSILLIAFLGLSYLAYTEISSSNEAEIKAQESIEKFESMEAEKNSLQTQLDSSKAELERLQRQIEQTSTNRDAAVERKKGIENELNQKETQISELKSQISGQKTKISNLESSIASLEQEVASEKQRADDAEELVSEWEDFYYEGDFN